MNKQALGALLAIVVVLGGVYFYAMGFKPSSTPIACTADAMQCPDGSYVGRTGPDCQFVCPTATTTPTTASSTSSGAPIGLGDGTGVSDNFALGIDGTTALGSYLIAYNGATVYTYAKDTAGVSTCTGQCAANWLPYVVPAGSRLNLQAGVKGAIGTIVRQDGTTQVTYKGMPLYFYIQDKFSGDTKGQGVGGVWYVVKP